MQKAHMATDAPTKQKIHAVKLVAVPISFTYVCESLCQLFSGLWPCGHVFSGLWPCVASFSVAFGLVAFDKKAVVQSSTRSCMLAGDLVRPGFVDGFTKRHHSQSPVNMCSNIMYIYIYIYIYICIMFFPSSESESL